ncbi:IS4/Tn5 family transposase DNA-binding protein [Polaromonas sp. DSR2-3-2]|uniref:IS4/Tn5 family transposase DNA-binding protein n=1 Tax=unclassified Polaromonas TaxID=2638319 RepID=UPI003CED8584
MSWAAPEFESIDLGDPRHNRRANRLIERLNAKSTASIPQACGDWADTMAAYRFFGNEGISGLCQGEDLERRYEHPLFPGGDELHPR